MGMSLTQALSILAISGDDLHAAISSVPAETPNLWERRTEAAHKCIREARKVQLRRYHPDVCKDVDALERSQLINRVADELLKMQVAPPPPPQPVMRMVVFQSWGGWGHCTSASTTTTNTGTWYTGG
jgi:hypothetical protein